MIPPPTPWMARAATKTAMCPDDPPASRPAAKIATPASRAMREPRRSSRSPPSTMPSTDATRYALNGQPYQASPSSSVTAVGIAVATAIDSKATNVTSMSSPAVGRRCARSKTDARSLLSTLLANSFSAPGLPPDMRRAPVPRDRRSTAPSRGRVLLLLLPGGDLLGRRGDDGVQVADDAEVGELEDRRLGVLVDGDDRLRGLHPGPVLDGTGDADGDVQLRRDGLAGLPDLEGVRVEAGVDRGPGGADGRAEGVGQGLDDREVLRRGD